MLVRFAFHVTASLLALGLLCGLLAGHVLLATGSDSPTRLVRALTLPLDVALGLAGYLVVSLASSVVVVILLGNLFLSVFELVLLGHVHLLGRAPLTSALLVAVSSAALALVPLGLRTALRRALA